MTEKLFDKKIVFYIVLFAFLMLVVQNFTVVTDTLSLVWNIVTPLIIGGVIAYVIGIPIAKIELLLKKANIKSNGLLRLLSLIITILLLVLVALSLVSFVAPQIWNIFVEIGAQFPAFLVEVEAWVLENEDIVPYIVATIEDVNINWEELVSNAWDYISGGLNDFLENSVSVVSGLFSSVFNMVISVVFALYLIFEKDRIVAQINRFTKVFFPKIRTAKLDNAIVVADKTFSSFIVGQCTEAVVLGALCTAGMLLLGLPYATTIGVFVGVTALVPMVGGYVGAGVGAFLIFMSDPMSALFFLIYIVILQQLEGNLIYPRVVGNSIGLPGIWVLVAVVVGGGVAGVVGMLLGVPLAATIYKLLRSEMRERLQS